MKYDSNGIFGGLVLRVAAAIAFVFATAVTGLAADGAADVKTRFVEVGGRKIAYRSVGSGTPILLANRFRGNLDSWDPLFIDSLAKNYRVIIFNYSGFASSTGKPATDIASYAVDFRDLAAGLGLKKVIVGGWSFGGFVAQIAMNEYPDLVSHVVLIGTNPPGKNALGIEPAFFEISRRASYTVDDEAFLFFEPKSESSRKAAQASRDRIAKRQTDRDTRIPESHWDFYTSGIEDFVADPSGARDKIQASKKPILLISGDHDVCFPIENWIALSRKLATTQMIVFPQSGHGPQHQFPELTADYIDKFVKRAN